MNSPEIAKQARTTIHVTGSSRRGALERNHRKRGVSSSMTVTPVGPQALELEQLRKHIRTLVTLEETAAPMLSCYIRRGAVPPDASAQFRLRIRAMQSVLRDSERDAFDEALVQIKHYLATEIKPTTRGVALFARGGARPFFLGMQFQVPLVNKLSINASADIFHLVELKDTYDRYVVLIATEDSARILEVNLGAVTRDLWAKQPELRRRVGRQWTREHYQDHRRDRGVRFLKEEINVLDKLMAAGGHTHFILAGSPRITGRIRNALPPRLLDKLIDCVPAPDHSSVSDVVTATLSTFIEHEQQSSLDAVAELVGALRRGSLGAAGTVATLAALRHGEADLLVMAQSYQPGLVWRCQECEWIGGSAMQPAHCPDCADDDLRTVNAKEAIVKLAERQSLEVEIVEHSDALMALGGVGCLLRFDRLCRHHSSTRRRERRAA